MTDYRSLCRTTEGRLRVPFASIRMFLRTEGMTVSTAEARAIKNLTTFVFSAAIMCRRLKEYVDTATTLQPGEG
jgi:hypothetical protein